MSDRLGDAALILLALVLPASALAARRLPAGRMARHAAIWAILIVSTAALIAWLGLR
jgi:uncharacterized membrane protein YhaH (DUF805 family)